MSSKSRVMITWLTRKRMQRAAPKKAADVMSWFNSLPEDERHKLYDKALERAAKMTDDETKGSSA